jgi:hypothetical protein
MPAGLRKQRSRRHAGAYLCSVTTYEVSAAVDPDLVGTYERYMRETHIPAILATGCFRRVVFERSGVGRYRVRYQADSQADLDRYLRDHTARLRAEFAAQFPTGVELSREVWTDLQRWG